MMKLTPDVKLIAGGAVLVAVALWWFSKKGNAAGVGASLGGAAVDLVYGTTLGVVGAVNTALGIPTTSQVIAAANDLGKNPLQPFGSWLGTSIYDLTHPTPGGP